MLITHVNYPCTEFAYLKMNYSNHHTTAEWWTSPTGDLFINEKTWFYYTMQPITKKSECIGPNVLFQQHLCLLENCFKPSIPTRRHHHFFVSSHGLRPVKLHRLLFDPRWVAIGTEWAQMTWRPMGYWPCAVYVDQEAADRYSQAALFVLPEVGCYQHSSQSQFAHDRGDACKKGHIN
jgi:hypothetical protein